MGPPEGIRLPSVAVGGHTVEFEYAPCNFCGSTCDQGVFHGEDRLLSLPGVFRVVRCMGCGLLRQNPRPTLETIGAYYPEAYDPYEPALRDETNPLKRIDRWYGLYKRRRLVEKYIERGSILDIGCATGNLLNEMQRTGRWRAFGIEPNAQAASIARVRNEISVHVGHVSETDLPTEAFDAITLWNVVEHLHEPITDLRRVAALLRPGGLLVLSLPNLESFEVQLFREKWIGWDLPRHLYFFSRSRLDEILSSIGFRTLRHVCLSGGQLSFALSLRCMAQGQPESDCGTRIGSTVISSFPSRLLLIPAFNALARLGHATTVTVVAQKSSSVSA